MLATYRVSLAAQKRRYLTILQRHIVPLPSLLTLLWALSILDTILVTVTAGSLTPESLSCALSNRWSRLYSSRNAPRVRAIQDSFRCCGFNTQFDRAWPFQGGPDQVSARACVVRYGWKRACAESWENYEKGVLGLMCAVGAAGLVYKVRLFYSTVANLIPPAPTQACTAYAVFRSTCSRSL